jgi:hypothetical protein
MSNPRSVVAALLTVLSLACPVQAADWQPPSTCAVVVGVLKWEGAKLESFPAASRKDRELYDTLLKRGVARENAALLLDEQATLDNIRAALRAQAERCRPDGTFLFYYAGHGWKRPDGGVAFANYDFRPGRELALAEVTDILRRHFKGGRVLLLADCCHSGGLVDVAEGLSRAGIQAAALTSADRTCASTSNWTFTQTVLDGLNGDPLVDADGDGKVTLGELAADVAAAMKFREMQRAGYASHGVPADYTLATADRARAPRPLAPGAFTLKDYVLAPDGTRRRPGRITGGRDGTYTVEFYDYADKRTVELPASVLRKLTFRTHQVGEAVTVLWEGQPYPAKVLEVAGDFHRITYLGWSSDWDEWVLSNRMVATAAEAEAPAHLPKPRPGVEVEWEGRWWPATVLQEKDGKSLVHYTGWEASWDEWVGRDRLRLPAASGKPQDAGVTVAWGLGGWPGISIHVHIHVHPSGGPPEAAPQLEAQWEGQWWPAVLLQEKGGKYLVHYPGWDASWDEWVPRDRLRFPRDRKPAGSR